MREIIGAQRGSLERLFNSKQLQSGHWSANWSDTLLRLSNGRLAKAGGRAGGVPEAPPGRRRSKRREKSAGKRAKKERPTRRTGTGIARNDLGKA